MAWFDAKNVEGLLPHGDYIVSVEGANYRENAAKTGHFVGVTLHVVGGEHEGRSVQTVFNIEHEKQSVAARGRREFAEFLSAIDIQEIETPDNLQGAVLGRQLWVSLATEFSDYHGANINKIRAYRELTPSQKPAAMKPLTAEELDSVF